MDNDAALAQRCLSGDPEALRTFVERFQNLVFGLCLRVLGNQHDAEDACQEVLHRAVRHLERWDSARPLQPWVLKIAVNRCRTALDRRTRRPLVTGECEGWATSNRTTPDLAEELQQAIAALRPDYRICFTLFYMQELSVEEIAETLNCPTGTVKTWLYRARRELAERLRDRGVVDKNGYELHSI